MQSPVPSTDDIGRMYDDSAELSQIFIDGQEHLPYWYGYDDDASATEAAQRITAKVGEALGLRRGQRVLDAGCGVGAPAILLATLYDVHVTGITVSAAQVPQAQARAERDGVTARVTFEHADYMKMRFADGAFDAVVAMESLMHAPDLDAALAEIRRVLRPGGQLSITDCVCDTGMSPERFTKFTQDFGFSQLLSIPGWVQRLTKAGFAVEEYTQCGPRVYGMGLRYIDRADEIGDELVARFGEETVSTLKQSYRDYFQWSDEIGYAIITARKPIG